MTLNTDFKSDVEIMSMLREGKQSAWEYLYNKYAAMMYGAIMRFTDDEEMAEEILVESFVQLKTKSILSTASGPLFLSVLYHTYLIAKRILKSKGIVPKHDIEVNENFTILNYVIMEPHSLEEIAQKAGTTNEAVKTRLRSELIQLRNDILQNNGLQ